ncbi:hypothetical protein TVAG_413480 [Trichomonas vaginalis G3]|uniref:Uncharacterized protein n=1 Tax=Trichomonas vaginalis (strain ATCC PRA-98 / G3) TaxID=412133 RepID=A2F9I0_TRIV3|nr:protein ubiquitination [Trichomonas vaginalis G3]EAX98451.1 hypothetical protein TVAG_413480 [Trichomonas vaginalis G3]KAI5493615.1 protein ubiquitination [Trichomonas vaginalis G3]|eukprot:XP_001311381.1 hypothetical protein [Trichomonas vaginalis G3]
MLSPNNNNHKENKQYDKISTTDENIKFFERNWISKILFCLYDTFVKCSQERDLYSIKFAVDNGYHKVSHFNMTVIDYAVRLNNLSLVQDLISCGVDPNMRNDDLDTPLHYACFYNSFEVVKFLLTLYEIDINAQNKYGNTPLHDACRSNDTETVKLLLECRGINISIKNYKGVTAIDMTNDVNIRNLFNQK